MKAFLKEWWPIVLFAVMGLGLVAFMAASLVVNTPKYDALENPNRFRIESGGTSIGVALVTDRETGVQYLMNMNSGGVTVLLDKDGKPYLANGWRDSDGRPN